MYKLYILVILIIVYFLSVNNNIEKFSLNFPENQLKCKCDLENEIIERAFIIYELDLRRP